MVPTREIKGRWNPLLELKACYWRGSARPLHGQVKDLVPDELDEFKAGYTDWFQGIYPTDRESVVEAALRVSRGVDIEPLEYRMVTEKRGIVWVRHWISAGARAAKWPLEGFVQVLDERKRLEAECLRICEREKSAMGQELHDDVCQLLAGVACMLEVIGQKAKIAMPETTETFIDLAAQLNAGMDRARSLSHSLVPLRLVHLGLARALRELANQARKTFNLEMDVTVARNLPSQDPDQILHLYRVAQEAVSNAVKHGKATRVKLRLTRERNQMNLIIRDNGTGLPSEGSRRQGIGLHIMRYRAGALGGRFAISSLPRGGSQVSVTYGCVGDSKPARKTRS